MEQNMCEIIKQSLEGEHFHDYCSGMPEINNNSTNIPEASRKLAKIVEKELVRRVK